MLVKALRLRHLGQKLPKEALRLEVPMVGELRYEDQPHGRSSMVCLLRPVGGSTDPLVQLFSSRIKIEKRGILIRGTSTSGSGSAETATGRRYGPGRSRQSR